MEQKVLSGLYESTGPFVTIYLDSVSDVEDAAQRLELRWKNVLRQLAELGVNDATRDALTAARGGHQRGNTRVLVASEGRVVLATSLPEPPGADVIRVGPLPHLRPLLERTALQLPHVVVLADRVGADILAYAQGPDPVETTSVDGEQQWITKVHAGGWSERRYQARAEEGWEHNAKDVAEMVGKVANDVSARLIVAAGDVRAVELMYENLDSQYQPMFERIPGSSFARGRARLGGGKRRQGVAIDLPAL